MDSNEIFSRIIHQDEKRQVRITVNEFREVEYLHVREYYQDMDEEWLPSNKGVSMPLDMFNTRELFTGLLEILSLAESKTLIQQHFSDILRSIYEHDEIPGHSEPEILSG